MPATSPLPRPLGYLGQEDMEAAGPPMNSTGILFSKSLQYSKSVEKLFQPKDPVDMNSAISDFSSLISRLSLIWNSTLNRKML
ncbi:hypothetical protein TNCV_4299281 [Trichonephila clavipes]|nr:hypothetical protein TNCV_4299281 [Trichonephila clavipes]